MDNEIGGRYAVLAAYLIMIYCALDSCFGNPNHPTLGPTLTPKLWHSLLHQFDPGAFCAGIQHGEGGIINRTVSPMLNPP